MPGNMSGIALPAEGLLGASFFQEAPAWLSQTEYGRQGTVFSPG